MADVLGWRGCFGVVTPSTNTVVQPEYDEMRPRGVTNHVARMHIPNDPLNSDADFDELIHRIDAALEAAVERVMTAEPDRIVLGISAESIWSGGMAAARAIQRRVDQLTGGLPFTQAADALPAALETLGVKGPIGLVTPYYPTAHKHLVAYMAEIGCEVVAARHLERPSPVGIGRTPLATLRAAIAEVNLPETRAVVQFGANLPMMRLAAQAEAWLGKPVLCINAVTYWHALRSHGIRDQLAGCGRLLEEH
jgi:maleate isomerase